MTDNQDTEHAAEVKYTHVRVSAETHKKLDELRKTVAGTEKKEAFEVVVARLLEAPPPEDCIPRSAQCQPGVMPRYTQNCSDPCLGSSRPPHTSSHSRAERC